MFEFLVLTVKTLDSATNQINHFTADKYISTTETNCAIHWIEISTVDRTVQLLGACI